MRQSIPIALIFMGALLGTGCATKNYVKKTVDPVKRETGPGSVEVRSAGPDA